MPYLTYSIQVDMFNSSHLVRYISFIMSYLLISFLTQRKVKKNVNEIQNLIRAETTIFRSLYCIAKHQLVFSFQKVYKKDVLLKYLITIFRKHIHRMLPANFQEKKRYKTQYDVCSFYHFRLDYVLLYYNTYVVFLSIMECVPFLKQF